MFFCTEKLVSALAFTMPALRAFKNATRGDAPC